MHCTLLIAESHHCTRLLGSFEIPLVTCAKVVNVFGLGVRCSRGWAKQWSAVIVKAKPSLIAGNRSNKQDFFYLLP